MAGVVGVGGGLDNAPKPSTFEGYVGREVVIEAGKSINDLITMISDARNLGINIPLSFDSPWGEVVMRGEVNDYSLEPSDTFVHSIGIGNIGDSNSMRMEAYFFALDNDLEGPSIGTLTFLK